MPVKKLFCLTELLVCSLLFSGPIYAQSTLKGAWELSSPDGIKKVVVATDDYFMQATYNEADSLFIESLGGRYSIGHGSIEVILDFNSSNGQLAGNTYTLPIDIKGDSLVLTNEYGDQQLWHRTDEGKGSLAGCWQITRRQQNNQMHTLADGDRKTLKLLSGKHFQWTAFNTATGEFSGCGGGHYTFKHGKYTEYIDFFSRDNSRVGMALSFDDQVRDSLWYHKGKSTKGAPVYEIWKLR